MINDPLQNEIQKRNFRYVQIDAIGVSISNVAAPFLPVFLTRLGASNFQVGLLTSIPGITGLILAIIVGRFLQTRSNIVPWYRKMLSKGVLTGRVDMTRVGSAFIVVEGREEDIFVAQKNLHNALNRDIVNLVLVEGRGKRQEGKVTSIIEHATEQFIGILRILRRQAVVIPDRMDLPFDVAVEDAHLMAPSTATK